MLTRGVAVTIVTLAAAAFARAGPYDAKVIFYSDSVLRGALENIAQMQEPELRAFTHYLAECEEATDPASKHTCAAAQTTYEIEFGDKRALDDMILARSIMLQIPSDMNDPEHLGEEAVKYGKILVALERAVRGRFRELKALRK